MRFITRLATFSLVASVASFATAQALVTERSISVAAALELASAALERCRDQGHDGSLGDDDHAEDNAVEAPK